MLWGSSFCCVDIVSTHSGPGWPGTCCADQADLELSTSGVLGLKHVLCSWGGFYMGQTCGDLVRAFSRSFHPNVILKGGTLALFSGAKTQVQRATSPCPFTAGKYCILIPQLSLTPRAG